ncbi:putative F-box and leucine rich repeat containing protein [Phytophthora palmivora]|uniref:F-box and leucine rich repeat containing protein n=1 Tax=Phytophthora palmivora TaxID=4796 RepID=A0A2P4XYG7_9STRA|nr:putative F-box and leucine rich repeat containing protein [Phytophthora palmivora]
MGHLSKVFPHVWCLRLQDSILDEMPTMESLVPWLDKNWKLRELVLTRVTCISGFYIHLEAEQLTKFTIRQCYQVQEPAIVAPNLETLIIEHCPVVGLHADTKLPQLKKLSLSSRTLTALHARHLIKDMLSQSSALKVMSFAGCSQLEQVLVDPGDLPALRCLDLSGCPKLTRVHVTSKLLETLDLARNDNLQYILLDLERVVDLDLSFLKNLTHLYIRSSSLRRLNLRGCDQLMRNTTRVNCPNLQFVTLQGTTLVIDDLNKLSEVTDEVFALP